MKAANSYSFVNRHISLVMNKMIYNKKYLFSVIAIITLVFSGCEKINMTRILKLDSVCYSELTARSTLVSGEFIDFGNNEIHEYGICWALFKNPGITDYKLEIGQQPEYYSFSTEISGLLPDHVYFTRAYARTIDTVVYGQTMVFITLKIELATVTTRQVTQMTANSALSGGNVTDDGNSEISERGVCWGIDQNPTIRDSKTSNGTGIGEFTSQITGLIADQTYYVRAYASNEIGTSYGVSYSFKTLTTK